MTHLEENFLAICLPFSPQVCFGVVSGPMTSGASSLSIVEVSMSVWTFEGLAEPCSKLC
jgi:hypothetical protein